MATPKSIDNGAIYELVNATRIELKSDIIRVENKFDALETGRLTRAEANIATLQVREATLNTKVIALVFILSATTSAIVYALAARLINH